MGWRRARGNRIGSKPGIPIGLQPDVAPRKTSADPVGPHSSRWDDRARRAHSCTAAPASSADAWYTWWRGAATRSWRASCRAACISAASTSAARMRGSCRAFGSARDRRPTSCSLKSLITPELTTVLAHVHSSAVVGVLWARQRLARMIERIGCFSGPDELKSNFLEKHFSFRAEMLINCMWNFRI